MIAVKNIAEKDIKVSFEGYTYEFPQDKTRLIQNKLYEHIRELWPKGVFHKLVKSRKQMLKVKRTKTKSYVKPEGKPDFTNVDMRITKAGSQKSTFGSIDGTPRSGTVDGDGVEWYGEGAVIEGSGEVFK